MPNPGGGPTGYADARRAALIEDVEFLVKVGTPSLDIPTRVGFQSMEALKRQLARLGRHDLVMAVTNSEPSRTGCRLGRTGYTSRMSA